jgi:hypothetical protein
VVQELEPKAQVQNGAASTKLNDYPNHFMMIALRGKDGGAELHGNFAGILFVLGRGTQRC